MSEIDDLLATVFAGQHSSLAAEFGQWVRASRRFKAFALAYATKIRAKVRSIRDDAGLLDLRAELQAAALLLREERFALEYERYAAGAGRGPDFTVTFRTHTPFNVEVRRVRAVEWQDTGDARQAKLVEILADKIGQMPPSIINVLWLATEREMTDAEIGRGMSALRERAAAGDPAFLARRGFAHEADYLKHERRLSAVLLFASPAALWVNGSARHPLPPEIALALRRLGA